MKFYTSVSLFTGFGVPERRPAGTFSVSFEGGSVPQLSDEERRIGFNGTKLEDTNKTSVFGRVRAKIHLAGGLSLEAGVVPPLELNGAQPMLFDLGVGLPIVELDRVRIGARAYGQLGGIDGDFTCDAETVAAGSDPSRNPFLCEEVSEDRIQQRYAGLEISGAMTVGEVEPYLSLSWNYLDLEFDVNARYSSTTDIRTLGTSGSTLTGAAGVRIPTTDRLTLAAEVFYSPLDVTRPPATASANEGLLNLRALISYRVRD